MGTKPSMQNTEQASACDDFQIALEKRALGILSEQELTELAHHVSGCSECQRIGELIDSVRSMAVPAGPTSAMSVVRSRLLRRRRFLWMMAAIYACVCASAFVVFGPKWGGLHVVLSLAAMSVELFRKRRLNKLVAEQAQGGGELLAALRKEVLGLVQAFGGAHLWLVAVGFAGLGAQDLWQGRALMGGYFILLAIVMGAGLLWGRLVHLPRLRRELVELVELSES